MGDGRYYTDIQFLNIVVLTTLIIASVISMMLFLYRNNNETRNQLLILIYCSLIVLLTVKFSLTIVYSEQVGYILTLLSIILTLQLQLYMIMLLLKTYIIKSTDFKKSYLIVSFLVVPLAVYLCRNIFILSYNFSVIEFGQSYFYTSLMLSVTLLVVIIVSLSKRFGKKIDSDNYTIIILMLWFLPFLLFNLALLNQQGVAMIIELLTYLCVLITLNITFNKILPYGITLSIFNNVKDLIMDYVIIIDDENRVVYKNQRILNSEFFDVGDKVSHHAVEIIFSTTVEKDFSGPMRIVKVKNEKCFSFNSKDISNNGIKAGEILTFVDVTSYITMLDRLKAHQNETIKINEALDKYSRSVYSLEKEKEIHTLLNEIAENQEHSMSRIKSEITALMASNNDDLFDEKIQTIIDVAKSDLKSVREAVTTYMQYYEEA